MTADLAETLVEMRGVSRSFGHIDALQKLDLTLYVGEVLALLGDNGAGKSTLIKIPPGSTLQPMGKSDLKVSASNCVVPRKQETWALKLYIRTLRSYPG